MPISNLDRLTGLDASFLALETDGRAHARRLRTASSKVPPRTTTAFVDRIDRGLHLVPRYRQRLAFPPLGRRAARVGRRPALQRRLPRAPHGAAGARAARPSCGALAGRVFSQQLDRDKPLWEIWLVDTMADGRFALICKTHHALVDGISGVDILTVLFDLDAGPGGAASPAPAWSPRPLPSGAELLADARGRARRGAARGACADVLAAPDRAGADAGASVAGLAAMAAAGVAGAPPSPLNVRIGPHRRFAWAVGRPGDVQGDQGRAGRDDQRRRADRGRPARCARTCSAAGATPKGTELKAMVPISVRADAERGALGNRSRRCTRRCRSGWPTRSSASGSCTPRWRASRSPARPWARRRSRGSPTPPRRPCSARPPACSRASASST